jgi:hypothetical protein
VEWVRLGVEDFKRDDYEGARLAFGHAYSIDPKASTLISLALAELQSGHLVEGIRHLRAYMIDPGAEPTKVDVVRSKWLPRAEAQTARLAVEAPTGAALSVDGEPLGVAPLTGSVDVSVGDHNIVARLGSWSQTLRVSAVAGQSSQVKFDGGESAAMTPLHPLPPDAARAATAEHGGPSTAKVVTVVALATSAAVAGGIGVALALQSQSNGNQYTALSCEKLPPQPADSACGGLAQDGKRDTLAANWLYVGSGTLAAAALATWFFWPNAPAKSSWTPRPIFDGRSAGAVLDGSF